MTASLIDAIESRRYDIFEEIMMTAVDTHAVRPSDGKTALMAAAERGGFSALRQLVRTGVDIDVADLQGMTALMYAAKAGNRRCVDILLRAGADTSLQNKEGLTAKGLAGEHPKILQSFEADRRQARAAISLPAPDLTVPDGSAPPEVPAEVAVASTMEAEPEIEPEVKKRPPRPRF